MMNYFGSIQKNNPLQKLLPEGAILVINQQTTTYLQWKYTLGKQQQQQQQQLLVKDIVFVLVFNPMIKKR